MVAQKFLTSCLEQEKPPKVARRDPYHTTRPRRGLGIAMAAVPGHGYPTGALHRHHSLNHDIIGSAKSPLEKHIGQYRDTVHRYFLSVYAIILCNKMDFSFGANMAGFWRAGHIIILME